MDELKIISRKSVLARLQAIEVSDVIKDKYPDIRIKFITKETKGDLDLIRRFTKCLKWAYLPPT